MPLRQTLVALVAFATINARSGAAYSISSPSLLPSTIILVSSCCRRLVVTMAERHAALVTASRGALSCMHARCGAHASAPCLGRQYVVCENDIDRLRLARSRRATFALWCIGVIGMTPRRGAHLADQPRVSAPRRPSVMPCVMKRGEW